MKLLAIESSGLAASCAVWDDGIRAEFTLNDGRTHSEKLLPLIDGALAAVSMAVGDMEAIAVSIGPGSFTGLRIGVATANALAFAAGIPVVEVPTLAALARVAAAEKTLALLDARNARAYAAYYEGGALVWGPEALAIAELAPRVAPEAVAVGDLTHAVDSLGLAFYHALPRAAAVAAVAAELYAAGVSVCQARPRYLLKPQAQRALEGMGDVGALPQTPLKEHIVP